MEKSIQRNTSRPYVHLIVITLLLGAVVTSLFGITSSLSPTPIEYETSTISSFDIPTDIPIEDTLLFLGEELASEESSKRKDTIDEEVESRNSTGNGSTSGSYWEYPATILPCTRNGDDLLVLVNKTYQLPASYAPTDLVALETSGVRTTKTSLLVRSIVISALTELDEAAKTQGVDLAILSAYRSYATQQSTYAYWVNYNGGSVSAADMVSARPGHSQHQLGTAVDFTTSEIGYSLGQQFAGTQAGKWIDSEAWKYGFAISYPLGGETITGYSYEPWHYRFIGKDNASSWHNSGKTLEDWLREKNGA